MQQFVSPRNHVAEGAEILFLQHALNGCEHRGDLMAASHYFFVRNRADILRFGHARNGQLPAIDLLNVFRILLRADEFVVTAPDEVQEVVEKLADVGSPYEVVETKLSNPLAQEELA